MRLGAGSGGGGHQADGLWAETGSLAPGKDNPASRSRGNRLQQVRTGKVNVGVLGAAHPLRLVNRGPGLG